MWPTNDFNQADLDKLFEESLLELEVETFIRDNFDEETKALAETVEVL